MGERRRMGRELAARATRGTLAGDLDRATAAMKAAEEAYLAAERRFREVAGDRTANPYTPSDDPRFPAAELSRLHEATAEWARLFRKYQKIMRKRALGDRMRSPQSVEARHDRLRDQVLATWQPEGDADLEDVYAAIVDRLEKPRRSRQRP